MLTKKEVGRLLSALRRDRKIYETWPKSARKNMTLMYLDGKIWSLEEVLNPDSAIKETVKENRGDKNETQSNKG